MTDHRRTVTRRAYVLPGWAMIAVMLLVLVGAGTLGWLVVTGDDEAPTAAPAPSPSASASPTEPEPTPSEEEPEPTPSASESPTPSPTPSETEEPEPDRTAVAVSVLNASRTGGLAAQVSQQVQQAGWTIGAVGNWRGAVAANAVHYPQGREAEARLLADDLGIAAVAPVLNGMSAERLTVLVITTP